MGSSWGVDALTAARQVLAAIVPGWTGYAFAVSPVLEADVGLPPQLEPREHLGSAGRVPA